MLDLLMQRHRERTEHKELLTGITASTIVNFNPMGRPKQPVVPADFMPSKVGQRRTRKRRVSQRVVDSKVRNFFAAQYRAQQLKKGELNKSVQQ